MPRAIEEQHAPRTDEHPNVVGVNQRQKQNVGFAFVVRSVAAPAGALVEKLLPRVDGGRFDDRVAVEVVADLCSRNFHHLVDEHVVVAARKVDEVSESADFKEKLPFVGEACGASDYWTAKAKACGFHRGVTERFEFLVKVRHGTRAVILLRPLHNANIANEPPGHRSNPALSRDAVGIHREEHIVFGYLESAFESAFFGACNLRQVVGERKHPETRMRCGKFFENFERAVRGTVIDANNFPFANVILSR